jgi:outer membrane protein assembly factor BamB
MFKKMSGMRMKYSKLFIQKYVLHLLYIITISICIVNCSKEDNGNVKKLNKPIYGTGNWPSFRGEYASGVVDEQDLPDTWDVENGKNIKWKTLIPGLAHSSPIIWKSKIIITTAISSMENSSFRPGLYGDGDASTDTSVHRWRLYCLDKKSGELIWEHTATEGKPKDKRHIKSTYANSTPATDGKHVVALFGSEGLFCYDINGKFLWKKDLGRLDVGAYDAPEYEWGPASSPIIYKNLVIIQCDTQNESFIIACDINTGETVWRTTRNELPSWGTPTIFINSQRVELVTNSSNYIYGYNPEMGVELWRLGGSSKITAPTPVYFGDQIIVCSGRGPEAPIFAIRAGAIGNISLKEDESANKHVAWNIKKRGPYMPTPIIYRDYFFSINNNGRLDCYDFVTGDQIYSEKIPHKGAGFSASPVASDGRIFLLSEDGEIFVVKSGTDYELISRNDMGEPLMASPAISDKILYIRAQHHLFAIGLTNSAL